MELYTLLIDDNSESCIVNTTIHGAYIVAKSVTDGIRRLKEIEGRQIEPEELGCKIDKFAGMVAAAREMLELLEQIQEGQDSSFD